MKPQTTTFQEIDQDFPDSVDRFRKDNEYIYQKILKSECVNCDKKYDKRSIIYVVCSNGIVVWWHSHHGKNSHDMGTA